MSTHQKKPEIGAVIVVKSSRSITTIFLVGAYEKESRWKCLITWRWDDTIKTNLRYFREEVLNDFISGEEESYLYIRRGR